MWMQEKLLSLYKTHKPQTKMITAKEYFSQFLISKTMTGKQLRDIEKSHIAFAKLHVQAQQEAIIEKATVVYGQGEAIIDSISVRNAYPLDQIK